LHHDFWHERWRTGQTGFHQSAVHPFLVRWWPSLDVPADARVYVPLCGKSLDMAWLADIGHGVVGSELSALAIEEFFAAAGLAARRTEVDGYIRHAAGAFEILEGDALALTRQVTGPLGALYDRAALVALPPDMREPYFATLAALLPRGAIGLLISFEYPQQMKEGPPFSVETAAITRLCDARFTLRELERVDVLAENPKFAELGIPALLEIAYALQRI
jgi:thiopurine S-methyltransferase